MNKEYILNVDLDGTLADFDKKVREITGSRPSELKSSRLWTAIKKYNDEVEPFFESLEWMSGSKALWNFAVANFETVNVLTATGYTPSDGADQKRRWCAKELHGYNEVICVPAGRDKAKFASSNSILVDDRDYVVNAWAKAGGVGILHTSPQNSISQLRAYLDHN